MRKLEIMFRVLVILLIASIGYLLMSVTEVRTVKGTLYYPTEEQTDSTPYITASNRVIDQEDPFSSRYIAVSAYMETIYPMGTKVRISSFSIPELNGVYTVADRMNRRYSGTELIDILVSEKMYKRMYYTSGMFTIEEIESQK